MNLRKTTYLAICLHPAKNVGFSALTLILGVKSDAKDALEGKLDQALNHKVQ